MSSGVFRSLLLVEGDFDYFLTSKPTFCYILFAIYSRLQSMYYKEPLKIIKMAFPNKYLIMQDRLYGLIADN